MVDRRFRVVSRLSKVAMLPSSGGRSHRIDFDRFCRGRVPTVVRSNRRSPSDQQSKFRIQKRVSTLPTKVNATDDEVTRRFDYGFVPFTSSYLLLLQGVNEYLLATCRRVNTNIYFLNKLMCSNFLSSNYSEILWNIRISGLTEFLGSNF